MHGYFSSLNYSIGDEDARFELGLLPEGARQVIAVACSGGRVLPLLAKQPKRLVCVDVSPGQLAMTRLRLALLAGLERDDFLLFMGYREGMAAAQRQAVLADLDLPRADRRMLMGMFAAVGWQAPIYAGRFEQMLRRLHKLVHAITGKAGRRIFETGSMEQQRVYYMTRFPQRRWKLAVALLGNAAVLNSLLYRGEFPRNNLGISSFQRYSQIFESLFTRIPAKDSFFLQMIFLGRLVHESGFPVECEGEVYDRAKRGLLGCDIEFVRSDLSDLVERRADVDFVSASDVPSFMPDAPARAFLQRMRPGLAHGAMVVLRGHMRITQPDDAGFVEVTRQYDDAMAQERTQLWRMHVYRRSHDV